jgi:hypothetical protein
MVANTVPCIARAASAGPRYQPTPAAASMPAPRQLASMVLETRTGLPVASATIRRISAALAPPPMVKSSRTDSPVASSIAA